MVLALGNVFAQQTEQEYRDKASDAKDRGDYDHAISDLTRAIEISPDQFIPYDNRAIAYYYKKDYDKTWADEHKAQDLNQGVTWNPKFLDALKKASGRDK
jgi:tetratricopeptide (TPR) repeat protein